ncbi:MAG: hypothetical protein IAE82_08270 [Opitutaceae bacterium]|nr:hypothetical protein [Opitutaceae bacterium]
MLPERLQALLILQDRDQRRVQLEKALTQVPRERATVESRIAAHKTAIDAAKKAVTDLELKRKEIEATLQGFEEQIRKYRSQQMLVKKNDEYQALTREIELTTAKIGETEEAEIKVLYDLDTEKEKTKAAEKAVRAEIAAEEAQLGRLAEREKQARDDLAGAVAEVDKARSAVQAELLPRYDRLAKTAGLPVVVALHAGKCGGCHLKVSNGVETEARKGSEIVCCDNCGRILYFQA